VKTMSESPNKTGPAGDKRTTVAHVVQNLRIGGLERVVINLITGAEKKGYHSILYTLGTGGDLVAELEQQGHEVVTLQKRPGMDYILPFKLGRMFKKHGVDIVHAHNFSPLVYGALAGRLARVSGVIYTAHGVKTSSLKKQSLFQNFGLVDKMVYVSRDARAAAIKDGGVKDRNVMTIVNGIDLERYSGGAGGDDIELRKKLGLPDGIPIVGIVARLTPAKDHSNLFRAFKEVVEGGVDAKLLLVGDGELAGQLRSEVSALGLEDTVIFLGSRQDVPDLLGIIDLFVLSSYTEGLAMTLLEAMAAGLPVVATSVGGNTEAVVDGETGIIVPPRDSAALAAAVRELLLNKQKATEMGARGRERAFAHFGIDTMVMEYEKLYQAILR
jgi:sugar transferase (PEP-CTERM/EpsH1 system associated)